jgi:hypothetical protein
MKKTEATLGFSCVFTGFVIKLKQFIEKFSFLPNLFYFFCILPYEDAAQFPMDLLAFMPGSRL